MLLSSENTAWRFGKNWNLLTIKGKIAEWAICVWYKSPTSSVDTHQGVWWIASWRQMIHLLTYSLNLWETHWDKGRSVGFALSDPLIHWRFKRGEGSIPFTRSTYPPFSLNGLQLRYSSADSDSHNGFNSESSAYPSIIDAPKGKIHWFFSI